MYVQEHTRTEGVRLMVCVNLLLGGSKSSARQGRICAKSHVSISSLIVDYTS